MVRYKHCIFILFFCVIVNSAWSYAQQTELAKYGITQYITGSGPQSIALLDNNGAILLACKAGATRKDLQNKGIPFVESQIKLLKAWKILAESKDTLKTTMPILDSAQTLALRKLSRQTAETIIPIIKSDIETLIAELAAVKRSRNSYSILFSYVLDGLIWGEFEQKKIVKPRLLTLDEPIWSGETWAVYPPRGFRSGTNSTDDRGVTLNVCWSEKALPKMRPFLSSLKLRQILSDYGEKGFIQEGETKQTFAPYNIFDRNGNLTIPIIAENENNNLFRLGKKISSALVEMAPRLMDLKQLKQQFSFRDEQQALVIVYHEIMWDLVNMLLEQGLIQLPKAFAAPELAQPEDIADQIFIVRK